MPQLLPLRGLRYSAAGGTLSDLLAPPYDVINPAQQRALEARSPYNAVRLELAEGGEERYERVAGLVRDWIASGALVRDSEPMLYVYEQRFVEGGSVFQRRALIAGVEAQPWDEGAVKPHEYTMSGPKEDRLKLLEATRIQFSPVFMIARDRAGQLARFLQSVISGGPPDAEASGLDGEQHRLWAVEATRGALHELAPLLSESFYIADGHHRYETAVTYKTRRLAEGALAPDHPARFAMTAIVPASDPGLVIRPIHRMVPMRAPADWRTRLGDAFEVEQVKLVGDGQDFATEAAALLARDPANIVALGLEGNEAFVLRPGDAAAIASRAPAGHSEQWVAIAPNVLRYGVLEPLWGITDDDLRRGVVEYSHDATEVLEYGATHPGSACFLLNPVGIGEVMSLADGGERMPQKSTFFHPKLGTGLVFNPLEP